MPGRLMQILGTTGFLLIFLLFGSISEAKTGCVQFLSLDAQKISTETDTTRFLAYLAHLIEKGVIGEAELKYFYTRLKDQSLLVNPIFHSKTDQGVSFTESSYQIHYDTMDTYLQRDDLDKVEILNWLQAHLKHVEKVDRQRTKTTEKTQAPYFDMQFQRVVKGQLVMARNKKSVYLPHDIEVMTTKVTQWMWTKELGFNPSHFRRGASGIIVDVEDRPTEMQPDHPVETITWYAAAMFANELSKKHGFKEVYDFSSVEFIPGTKMEDGTLNIQSGEVKIYGDNIYETEGYRLPTEVEQEFLITDRGRATDGYFTGVVENNIADYAVIGRVGERDTLAVKEKLPLIIDGKKFYDLYGNTWEWGTWDEWVLQETKEDKYVEHFSKLRLHCSIFGGDAISRPIELSLKEKKNNKQFADERNYLTGFRLVRTVK